MLVGSWEWTKKLLRYGSNMLCNTEIILAWTVKTQIILSGAQCKRNNNAREGYLPQPTLNIQRIIMCTGTQWVKHLSAGSLQAYLRHARDTCTCSASPTHRSLRWHSGNVGKHNHLNLTERKEYPTLWVEFLLPLNTKTHIARSTHVQIYMYFPFLAYMHAHINNHASPPPPNRRFPKLTNFVAILSRMLPTTADIKSRLHRKFIHVQQKLAAQLRN